MRVYFYTFGCKVNQYETENIKQSFLRSGYECTSFATNADICIINTCTVTSVSDKKNRQMLRKIKKDNPEAIIVLTGCFPQAFEDEAIDVIEADIITGTANKTVIVDLVEEYLLHHQRIIKIDKHTKSSKIEPMINSDYVDRTRAIIKIQDGCDQYCSYCIIPYARGHIRSKPLEDLRTELETLAENAYKEIILVGINLSCYGKDLGYKLIDAIKLSCSIDGIERVRLGSLEPELISDDDISEMTKLDKLCPQFHLSIQSGCDKTLKEMNRKYTTSEFLSLVQKLRSAFKDCAITTDIMVGFPGESIEDFNESIQFAKKVGFAKSHVFPYSKRSGTPADKRIDQVDNVEKTRRAKIMSEVSQISQNLFLEEQIGKTVPVLIERSNSVEFYQGYSPNYTLIKIPAENNYKCLPSEIKYVKIIKVNNGFCIGEFVF